MMSTSLHVSVGDLPSNNAAHWLSSMEICSVYCHIRDSRPQTTEDACKNRYDTRELGGAVPSHLGGNMGLKREQ